MKALAFAAASFAALLAGCASGPTTGDLREEFQPRYAALGQALSNLAGRLPDRAADLSADLPLDPVPGYRHQGHAILNTDIVMAEQLRDPHAVIDGFDLDLSGYLLGSLRNFASETPPPGNWDQPAEAGERERHEQILATRYLCVARVIDYEEADVTLDDDRLDAVSGHVRIEGFFFDLRTARLLASFAFEMRPERGFHYLKSDDETKHAALTRGVQVNLKTRAQSRFMEELAERTGGRFEREMWD